MFMKQSIVHQSFVNENGKIAKSVNHDFIANPLTILTVEGVRARI